jgi:hypothetical protein
MEIAKINYRQCLNFKTNVIGSDEKEDGAISCRWNICGELSLHTIWMTDDPADGDNTPPNEGQRPIIIHDFQISVRYNVDVIDNKGKSSVCGWRNTTDFGFCLTPCTAGYTGSCLGRQSVRGAKMSLEESEMWCWCTKIVRTRKKFSKIIRNLGTRLQRYSPALS